MSHPVSVFFFCFVPHIIVLNIMFVFTFWDLKFGVFFCFLFVCQERFMICFITWFWEKKKNNALLTRSTSGPHFIYREPYCLNLYRDFFFFFMSDHLNHCRSSQENHAPPQPLQLCRHFTHRPFQPPSPPRLSALYIGIYLFFWKRREKKPQDCVRFEMTWREHETDPASLRGVNGIYSVYFLHAVHINPQRTPIRRSYYVSPRIGFFRWNIHHAPSRAELPTRDR